MNRDEACLRIILKEIDSIPSLLKGYSKDRFLKSEKTQKAVCMTLLNIGELVKALSNELKANNPAVPWKQVAGLRDLAAHKYHSLNMERIWITAKEDLPSLKRKNMNVHSMSLKKESGRGKKFLMSGMITWNGKPIEKNLRN